MVEGRSKDDLFDAVFHELALVVTIASMWTVMSPELVTARRTRAHRRRVVTTAVEALLTERG